MAKPSKLVIVESPAKAKTIAKYLGPEYRVVASIGHIRDLADPKDVPAELKKVGTYSKFAIDVESDFAPHYVVSAGRSKTVSELKAAIKESQELLLATDEDREGEAIAWHLLEVLKPKVPVKRMVFNEITQEAISEAVSNTRDIDENLVEAQETRRLADRLFGYEVSPLLWKKVSRGLSAGRVQSPAIRLIVQRERERMAHVAAGYASVLASLSHSGVEFEARLISIDGTRVATGKSFDSKGQLSGKELLLTPELAQLIRDQLQQRRLAVTAVDAKPSTRRPYAPFTTSTLQQEGSRKLGLSAKQTMDLAQQLYQEGHITYMRTDSSNLSNQAISAARSAIKKEFGADSLSDQPRVYASKSKNAQEAHEAIRPTGDEFKHPRELSSSLSGRALQLYELIWRRTVASQMIDAKLSTTTVKFEHTTEDSKRLELSAAGTVTLVKGFLAAYEESSDETPDDSESGESGKLPALKPGELVPVIRVEAKTHQTQPPARYTEATLVKALEERGIGRPSTYASIISNILGKGYVTKRGSALVPEWIAFTVIRFLEEYLDHLIDYEFTASMEEDLDRISTGELDRTKWLSEFYFGDGGDEKGLRDLVESLANTDARSVNSLEIAPGIILRTGKFGPYLEVSDVSAGADAERRIVNIPPELTPDELTPAKAQELIDTPQINERELGTDPTTGFTVMAKTGRYGPYVMLAEPNNPKPKSASLFKSMDLATVDLEQALSLLSLPREVGINPESGQTITAQNGKFGPYLKCGTDSRSLSSEEQILSITLDEALAIYRQPKTSGRRTAATPLREIGEDPASGLAVVAKTGQFGDYVTDGVINATVPKDEPLAELAADRAFELLAIRREKLGLEPGQAPKAVSGGGSKRSKVTRRRKN